VKGEINTAKPVSKFYVYVKNELSTPITVSGASVSASITVNGVPVSPGDITVVRPPEKVIRGHKTGKFAVEWNNGGTPRIGDTIVITGCVSQPGDQNPTNDCASISRPDGAFDFSTQVQTSVFDSRKTSAKAAVLVTNNGFTAGAIRAENITVTVKVNGEDTAIPVTLASPDRARFVKFGRTIKFSYVIDYGALNPGDEVEITSCVNVPGNVNAADGCSTSTQFVV
jgi:pectin methylesterase-like acyl-CoA thioesterase